MVIRFTSDLGVSVGSVGNIVQAVVGGGKPL